MNRLMIGTAVAFSALSMLTAACGGGDKGIVGPDTTIDTNPTPPPPPPPPPPPAANKIMAMAGNITVGATNAGNSGLTASLISGLGDTVMVMALGDLTGDGVLPGAYATTWGAFSARTMPVTGNREFFTEPSGTSYFTYWSSVAGESGKGWYSFDNGAWHIVVLNVQDHITSAMMNEQLTWLSADLTANAGKRCTMVVYHNARFLSSNDTTGGGWTVRGNQQNLWNLLYANNVDLVVNGSEHQYERFLAMDPMGVRDDVRGIVQINAGTGGNSIYPTDRTYVHAGRAAYIRNYGVLKLTLKTDSADFAFLNASNPSVTDAGTVTCH